MSGDAERESLGMSRASAWAVGIFVSLMVYVLSPGPVAWWIEHNNGGILPDWFTRLYAPLMYACRHSQTLDRIYNAYFGLFID